HPTFLILSLACHAPPAHLHPFPTRRSSDLSRAQQAPPSPHPGGYSSRARNDQQGPASRPHRRRESLKGLGETFMRLNELRDNPRSEEHTSELQSREKLVCRLLLEKKKEKSI